MFRGPPPKVRHFVINPNSNLVLSVGDITRWKGDAIVNAANERMLGGGGVDGAIHRAAGPELLKACREVPEVRPGVRCPTGEAKITPGFHLEAKYVIHTVGPVYDKAGPKRAEQLLYACYSNSLKLANEHHMSTVAFPAISTGVYGYPPVEAAKVAVRAVKENVGALSAIHFVLFNEAGFEACLAAASAVLQPSPEPQGGGEL